MFKNTEANKFFPKELENNNVYNFFKQIKVEGSSLIFKEKYRGEPVNERNKHSTIEFVLSLETTITKIERVMRDVSSGASFLLW